MEEIGKVIDMGPWERDFEWKIEDFSTLSTEDNKWYESPLFYFANASWCLQINPNGRKVEESIGYIDVFLCRKPSGLPISVDYSLILKTMSEKTDRERHASRVFEKTDEKEGWGFTMLLKRSEFLESRSELGLPDVLTVICTMKYRKSTKGASEKVTAQCSYCKKPSEAETISFHEGKCLDKPIKCPDCHDVIPLRDWYDHQCQKSRSEASEKLYDDFKEMMLNGDNRDTIIKVKGEEFQLHRDVLVARSTYFRSMFQIDMKEKNTSVVSMDDCEPGIFRTFLHFVYTGKVDKLSEENVCNLYETADKYLEHHLKKQCLNFMMKSLSEETFCDYIALALKYDERKLFEDSVELFISKPKEIVRSVKWQIFAKEYATQANELFIKTLDQYIK